ncbi:YggT family protein [Sphingomicrobium astaxanthinifaciens]|uniref:YggT family protein n=1 Tax=Sphingomicrobium astaxanthinifaciens TaxID=1227949 RepID=UPI001FCA9515|nr:YggT family protein [Sphingomicrobium astaxanthinifaciens]MCJ7421305.1 YggT family protein [Sphingomicrobium astaxanthinifaciens]
MIYALFAILSLLLTALFWVIVAQVVISWLFVFKVLDPYSRVVATITEVLERITAPIYRPIRKLMPDFGPIDLSPMIVILGIIVLRDILFPGILMELGPTVTR